MDYWILQKILSVEPCNIQPLKYNKRGLQYADNVHYCNPLDLIVLGRVVSVVASFLIKQNTHKPHVQIIYGD